MPDIIPAPPTPRNGKSARILSEFFSDRCTALALAVRAASHGGEYVKPFAGGARGTDPFGAFIEHQEKQIVLLATGGTLMSLAESGAGTLAGNAQSDVWQSIVARDSSVIASQINRALLKPYLERAFPGRPAAVQFGFDFTKPPTPKEVFEVAALARQAGYAIDLTELEEQTGYTLKEVPGAGCLVPGADQVPGASCLVPGAQQPFMNKEPGPAASAPADATLAAFAKDTTPAAKAIQALLQNPSKEAAEALLKDLPSLLPDDPALAAVIADAMAEEFGKTVANKEAVANKNPYHCPKCGKFSGFNGHCEKCGYTLDGNEMQKRAERLMKPVLDGDFKHPIKALAYRDGLGQIDLDVGKLGIGTGMEHGNGLAKINQKHDSEIASIPHTLAHGKIYRLRSGNDPQKPFEDSQRAIIDGTKTIFLERKEGKRWSITSIYDDAKKVKKIERAAAE